MSPTTENVIHDISRDTRIFAEFAARWEDHCRKTGQNPWRWTNEDGSVDKEKTDGRTI